MVSAVSASDLQLTGQDEQQISLAREYNKCRVRYTEDPPQFIVDEINAKALEDIADLKQKNAPEKVINAWLSYTVPARFEKWLDGVCVAETKVDWDYLQQRAEEIKKQSGDSGVQEFFGRMQPQ